jgi:hypothetical protein
VPAAPPQRAEASAAAEKPATPLSRRACTAPRRVVERFIDADCADCWGGPASAALPASTWVLDWITPGASGAEAPLATAALTEATERLASQPDAATVDGARRAETRLATPPALRMKVVAGPAWNGYLGLQLQTRGTPPAGALAYIALVEDIAAGEEGNAVARRLVRSVAGPFALQAPATRELRALRIPDGAKPERLIGVAWWVDASARLGGIAAEGCPR